MKLQKDWDKFYMDIADLIAQQSYAEDRKVGAIIVKGDNIISFSYNGTPRGTNNDTQQHEVLHAESQAIAKVARSFQSTVGSTMYCTLSPCIDCAKLIYAAGIYRLVYRDEYKCNKGIEFLKKVDVKLNVVPTNHELADPEWIAKHTGLS